MPGAGRGGTLSGRRGCIIGRLLVASLVVLVASVVASLAAGGSDRGPAGQWQGSEIEAFGEDYWVRAAGINQRGQVLGCYAGEEMDRGGGVGLLPLGMWQGGVLRPLPIKVRDCDGDLNDRGQVVGTSRERGGFLLSNGKTRWLSERQSTRPYGLNNRGQVVGDIYWSSNRGEGTTAFVWDNGRIRVLATPKRKSSVALAINERGVAVGWISTEYGYQEPQYAAVWRDGRLNILPSLGGQSAALDINERGQIVGWSAGRNGKSNAVLWQDGRARALDRRFSEAHAISDSGVIVGLCGAYRRFPCVWEDGRVTPLPTRSGARDLDVNNKRMVVGTLHTCGDPAQDCTEPIPTVHLWKWHPAK